MRHADPKGSIVVGGPVAFGDLYGCEVAIEERARADLFECVVLQFDPAVGILNCF